MDNKLIELVEKGVITSKASDLIMQYVKRLEINKMPVIFNLRHLRKILIIKKIDQDRFFGEKRIDSYVKFFIPKRVKG